MNKRILLVVILQFFAYISNDDINLQISRARAHSDQTGDLIPLVVSLSSPDKNEKTEQLSKTLTVINDSLGRFLNQEEEKKESINEFSLSSNQ